VGLRRRRQAAAQTPRVWRRPVSAAGALRPPVACRARLPRRRCNRRAGADRVCRS